MHAGGGERIHACMCARLRAHLRTVLPCVDVDHARVAALHEGLRVQVEELDHAVEHVVACGQAAFAAFSMEGWGGLRS